MTQPAHPPLTLNEILKRIADECARLGVDIDDLPRPQVYSWWHPKHDAYQHFRHAGPHPWDANLAVVAMFRDEDELRIFTIRIRQPDPPEEPEHPLKRFVLSKRNQSYEVEMLPLDGFVQAIADEWTVVAEGMTTADAERERAVAFLRRKGWGVAADAIDGLEHLEDEEAPGPGSEGRPASTSSGPLS